jgi:hypothetical protein
MSQYGEVQFPPQKVATVCLVLEFCSERFPTILVHHPEHNEFTFRFQPTIMEVFFENFSLLLTTAGLSGRHPFMREMNSVMQNNRIYLQSERANS